jgi:hypothetical protein
VKAYEFALYTHARPSGVKDVDESSFFSCGSLRGICEDIIVLKYFAKLERADRDEMLHTQMVITTLEEFGKQAKFFERICPYQPVLRGLPDARLPMMRTRIHEIVVAAGLWQADHHFPSINAMAKAVDLQELYDY